MQRSILRRTALAAGALALARVEPGLADWLVTRDGAAIETDGPWRLEAEQVIFTLHGGGLAALPLAEVDLEASRARTSPAIAAAPAQAPASRWTITDRDVARALAPDEATEPGSATEGSPPQTSSLNGVSVVSWEGTTPPELGVSLVGTVRNDGTDYAANLRVHVALYDESGDLIERQTAVPTRTTLAPGEATEFAVDFPEATSFAEVRFDLEGRGFSGSRAGAPEEAAEETAAEPEAPPLEEENLDEVPGETLDETYGEGIEEELPAAAEDAADSAAS